MVASAEGVADFIERRFGQLARKLHCHLAREGNVRRTAFARHIGNADIEMLGDALLDLIDRDRAARFFLQDIFQ
jgi:hypothetical protein